jgi:hypothetical protein
MSNNKVLNRFEQVLQSLRGETIRSAQSVEVHYRDCVSDAVLITTENLDRVAIVLDVIDCDLVVLEDEDINIVGTGNTEWSASYSSFRDEVYIYDKDGKQIFTIPSEDIVHGMEYMDEDDLKSEIRMEYEDVLIELGLE